MRRRLIVVAIFGAAGAVALAVGLRFGLEREAGAGGRADSLFAITLPDASGQEQRIDQWRGKVLVVNFWATWCAPCKEEMPEFIKAQQEWGGRGVQFVGIAVDDAQKVRAFADEIHLNYPALVGGFSALDLSKTFGNRIMALPFTIIIDRDGRLAHTQLGPLTPALLQSVISKIV